MIAMRCGAPRRAATRNGNQRRITMSAPTTMRSTNYRPANVKVALAAPTRLYRASDNVGNGAQVLPGKLPMKCYRHALR